MMGRWFLVGILCGVLFLSLGSVVGCSQNAPQPTRTRRFPAWESGDSFLLGVNYPWLNYGHDFGTTAWGHDGVSAEASKKQIDEDFARLKKHGARAVRWFVFGDGRASPEFSPDGYVTGFDQHFYADLEAALAIAQKHDVYLILVLLDFHLADEAKQVNGVQTGGRSEMITDAKKRQSFLDKALKPLLERCGEHPNIFAWEVINEPEGAMDVPGGGWVQRPIGTAEMQAFVRDVAKSVHTHSFHYVTLGSASRRWLNQWKDVGLDFYQYHYYEKMEGEYPLDYPCADLRLDKPCIIGEFPTKGSQRTMTQYLDTIHQNGYAGALAWSLRAEDEVSEFEAVSADFTAWAEADEVQIASPAVRSHSDAERR
jgi:hypothetical protein